MTISDSPNETEERMEKKSLETKEEEEEEETGEGDGKQKRRRKRKRKKKDTNVPDNDNDNDNNDKEQDDTQPAEGLSDPQSDKKTLEVDRTVYMEGIPFACSEDDVRAFFAQNGLDELVDVRLPVWQDSGRLRGYGHIVLPDAKAKQAALALNGQYLGQRYVTIKEAQKPKNVVAAVDYQSNPSRTLMLHNLSYQATEDDLTLVLGKYGDICDGGVRVVRHSDTGRSKGFAYVEFAQQDTAMQVVKENRVVICGRPCRVDYDHGRVRGSFRTADRKLWHKEYNPSQQHAPQHDQASSRENKRSKW